MGEHPGLFDEPILPVLPYGGTSGWSGSETSRERAICADRSGATSERQRHVVDLLASRAAAGMTWRDLSIVTGWHHGTASGALSVLHKAGVICRLDERRDRCAIYVHPDHVHGRTTQEHRPNSSARLLSEMLEQIETDLSRGLVDLAIARIQATRRMLG